MSTFIESPQVEPSIVAPQVEFVPATSLRKYSSFSPYRLVLPALCIAIAASVGTATGLTLAMIHARNGVVEASTASVQPDSSSAQAATNLASNSTPAPAVQTAAVAPPAASSSVPAVDTDHPAAKSEVRQSTPNHALKAQPQSGEQLALNQAPDAVKPATVKLAGKPWPAARPTSIPVSEPAQHELASASFVAPTALDPTPSSLAQSSLAPSSLAQSSLAPSSLDGAPKPVSLYSEGDVTVAGYDAASGTIQASDGATFVLGTTVAASYATSWSEYHSGVHYRCDQAGSCVLTRAGVVAPKARLVQENYASVI